MNKHTVRVAIAKPNEFMTNGRRHYLVTLVEVDRDEEMALHVYLSQLMKAGKIADFTITRESVGMLYQLFLNKLKDLEAA